MVEDDTAYARIVALRLSRNPSCPFEVHLAKTLKESLEFLWLSQFALILLDLTLPDSQGLETLRRICAYAPNTPVVVLTGLNDRSLAVDAVRNGAQDYLSKGRTDLRGLHTLLAYAIERHQNYLKLWKLSLDDQLTGLLNRRGFLTLAQQQIKLAERSKKSFLLFFADLDGLKKINDQWGHAAGDQALVQTAGILKKTFRASDIVARLGGDEFAALAIDAEEKDAGILRQRLNYQTMSLNRMIKSDYSLSISVGWARYDIDNAPGIEEVLSEADKVLYESKKKKVSSSAEEQNPN